MVSIRPYQPSDREQVFCIAADTAYFGEKVENFMEDRNLFCDAFCTYYTDYEPQHAWVAENEGGVVGYLLGCSNTKGQARVIQAKVLPKLIKEILLGKYSIGRLTLHYGYGLILAGLHHQTVHADLDRYPAHFHLNIAQGNRGGGLGKHLLAQYIDQIHREGIKGIHLKTTSENIAACALYES